MSEDSVNISKDSGEGRSLAVQSDAGSIDFDFKRDTRKSPRARKQSTPARPRSSPFVSSKPAVLPTRPSPPPQELHAFINARKDLPVNFDEEAEPEAEPEAAEDDYGGYYSDGSGGGAAEEDNGYGSASGSEVSSLVETQPLPPYRTLREEKEGLLLRLYELRRKGHPVPDDLGFHTDIHDLRFTVKRIEDELTTGSGVEMARHALIFSVGMIEMLNEQYNPFDLHLKNFSHDVMSQINSFDDTLERLVKKYKTRVAAPPELALVFSLVAIGAATHMRESRKVKTTVKVQPVPQPSQSEGPTSGASAPVRKEMPGPTIGSGMGSFMSFPMPSRAPLNVVSVPTPSTVPLPVPSRLAPEPRREETKDDEVESKDSQSDRMSDVITEAFGGKGVDMDDNQSVNSEQSAATTRTRAKRRKTPPAPLPTGKIVTI